MVASLPRRAGLDPAHPRRPKSYLDSHGFARTCTPSHRDGAGGVAAAVDVRVDADRNADAGNDRFHPCDCRGEPVEAASTSLVGVPGWLLLGLDTCRRDLSD